LSPLILSREKTDQEVSWTIGEYLEPRRFRKHLDFPPFAAQGRRGTQPALPPPAPNFIGPEALRFLCLAALIIHTAISLLAENKVVYEKQFLFQQSDREKSLVTEVFELPGHTSNVVFRSAANVNNGWLYLQFALIHEEGRAYEFGRRSAISTVWTAGNGGRKGARPTKP